VKINCIVIDDEPLAIDQMTEFIGRIEYLKLLKSFDNGMEPINFLKNNKVDLIFLDIQMENFTGIELLESLETKPKVILTTAYDSYALKGYELDVSDYLLKPISFKRFVKAVDKIYNQLSIQAGTQQESSPKPVNIEGCDFIFIRTEHKMEKLAFNEILYIEGLKEYLIIFKADRKLITRQSFKKMLDLLPDDNFIRVHKSYIVAIDKIITIERNRLTIAKAIIPRGETFKKYFFDHLEKKKLM